MTKGPKEAGFKSGSTLDLGKPTLDFGKAMDGGAKKIEPMNRFSSVTSPTQQNQKAANLILGTGIKPFHSQCMALYA